MMHQKELCDGIVGARAAIALAMVTSPLLLAACGGTDEFSTGQAGESASADSKSAEPSASVDPLDVEARAILIDPDYFQIPNGLRLHRSCIHEVPDGAKIGRNADGSVSVEHEGQFVRTLPACKRRALDMRNVKVRDALPLTLEKPLEQDRLPDGPRNPTVNGWVEASYVLAPNNGGRNWFARITSNWTVPANPLNTGGLVYFFVDLVTNTSPTNAIIQPVLQWGTGPDFGGNFWTIASWWVVHNFDTGQDVIAVHSTPRNASAGQTILGSVSRISNSCTVSGVCDWNILISNQVQFSQLTVVDTVQRFRRADRAVLEAYGINDCNQFPNSPSITFNQQLLYQPAATGDHNPMVEMYPSANLWTGFITTSAPACGYSINSISRGAVLTF